MNSAYYRAFPSSFVNFIWIGIAIVTILNYRKGRAAAARTLLIILTLVPCGAMAADAEPSQTEFYLPTPEDWRTETIPFPLEFAPPGEYELKMVVRDELSGKTVEVREPFTVSATAAVPVMPTAAPPAPDAPPAAEPAPIASREPPEPTGR